MTEPEFRVAMRPFLDTFGADNYPPPRMQLIWVEVKDLPVAAMNRIVRALIGEYRPAHAPKVSAFKEHAETELKKQRDLANTNVMRNLAPPPVSGLESYPTGEDAFKAVSALYAAMVENAQVPEYVRKDFVDYAHGSFPQKAAEVDWLKSCVEKGIAESRAEYVRKAKLLIWEVVTRARFQPGLLRRKSQMQDESPK